MASSSPRLTVLGGPLAGKELSIEDAVDNVLIGSDPSCRFCLPLPGISPIHARVWVDLQGVTIYDTNAPEGLYVNDDKVTGQAPLRNGDILWLGAPGSEGVVMIQCRIPPRAAAAAAPVPAMPVAPEPEDDEDEYDEPTVALPAPVAEPASATEVLPPEDVLAAEAVAPEPVRVEPAPEPDETVQVAPPVEATIVLPPTPPPAPLPVEPLEEDLGQTVVTHGGAEEETVAVAPPVSPPPAEVGTLVLGGELPPWTSTPVPPPIATTPAPVPPSMELPPVSPVFEEDIEEGVPATLVLPAEPPPPPAPAPAPPRAAAPPPAPVAKPVSRPAAPARPAPVKATPAKPAPAPVAAPPAAAPAPAAPRPPKAKSGGGGGLLIGLAAVLLLVAGGGGAAWYFLLGPGKAQPTPVPSAPPVTLAQATPPPATPEPAPTATPEIPVEETTVPVAPPTPSATPSPAAKPTPTPTPGKPSPSPGTKPSAAPTPDPAALRAQQVATLVGQADQAAAEKRYDAAVALYDQALQLEPGQAQAARGKAQAQAALSAAAAVSKRAFVSGRSVLVGAKTDKKLSGFESEDVAMAKAPDYSGRIEFEASPKSPRGGEPYTVRVFLLNDGKKDFKISGMTASTNASGEKSGGPMAATTREIAPQQRALIQELTGTWKEGATSWSLDVSVQSAHGETVKNTLTWR